MPEERVVNDAGVISYCDYPHHRDRKLSNHLEVFIITGRFQSKDEQKEDGELPSHGGEGCRREPSQHIPTTTFVHIGIEKSEMGGRGTVTDALVDNCGARLQRNIRIVGCAEPMGLAVESFRPQ